MTLLGPIDYAAAHTGDFRHAWCVDKAASLCEKIDRWFGGWPVQFNQLGFEHSESRVMTFAKNQANHGWWTCILTDQEYFRHKCGAAAPKEIDFALWKLECAFRGVMALPRNRPA